MKYLIPVLFLIPLFGEAKKSQPRMKTIAKISLKAEKKLQLDPLRLLLPEPQKAAPVFTSLKKAPATVDVRGLRLSVKPAAQKFAVEKKSAPEAVLPLQEAEARFRNAEPVTRDLAELSEAEFKMLQALIFSEKRGNAIVALNLFSELASEEGLYHYADMARVLGLTSEFRGSLFHLFRKSKDQPLKKAVVQSLLANAGLLQIENTDEMETLQAAVEDFNLNTETYENYNLKRARFESQNGRLQEADLSLALISPKSAFYAEAALLRALNDYRRGRLNEAVALLEKSWPLTETDKKSPIRNLTALTLARLYFQKAEYKAAYDSYLKIDRSSPLWLQAMVEEAWAQILAGDHIGAAGNMFSLHTEFFRKAYAPETYVVRTVGYLNLCQFGDGASVLNDLNRRYTPLQERLVAFQKQQGTQKKYYEVVRGWLKNTEQAEVEGLPRSFLAELARHPAFTMLQNRLNGAEEEIEKFAQLEQMLSQSEQKAKVKMQLAGEKAALKRALALELQLTAQSQVRLQKIKQAVQTRLQPEKEQLKAAAAKVLQSRFELLTGTLQKLLEQKDVLAYEIYSGAGEHLRYQMAGGETDARKPAELTPDEKKSYKWKFNGEVWEDEIGHYRSSLKNVCPQEGLTKNEGAR